jgi:hypothetical protein
VPYAGRVAPLTAGWSVTGGTRARSDFATTGKDPQSL